MNRKILAIRITVLLTLLAMTICPVPPVFAGAASVIRVQMDGSTSWPCGVCLF